MNGDLRNLLRAIVAAVLSLVIIIGGIWWVFALAHGVFAVGPFIALMAGIILVSLLTNGDERDE